MTTPRALTEHLVSREQGGLPLRWRSWEKEPCRGKWDTDPANGEKSSSKMFAAASGAQPAFPFQLPLEGKEEDPPGSSRAVRNTG